MEQISGATLQLWPLAFVDGNQVYSETESKHKVSLQFSDQKKKNKGEFQGKKLKPNYSK